MKKNGKFIFIIVGVFSVAVIILIALGSSSGQSSSGYVSTNSAANNYANNNQAEAQRRQVEEDREYARRQAEAQKRREEEYREYALKAEEERRKAVAAAKARQLKEWEKSHLLTTNLYWIYGGKKSWSLAKRYCGNFTDKEMGFSSWRLPTVNELRSLNGKESDRFWISSEYSYWDNRNKGVGTDSDPRHKVEYMFYCVRNK